MSTIAEECLDECNAVQAHSLEDYGSENPRWCKGCGDHGVLASLQRVLQKNNVEPENAVAVSGIGCSSRLPHYLRTYGFHGIHGRALPIATGVRLARPELPVIVTMGDGDCFSIGGNHWLHAIRYNINAVVLVLDNAIYALTKNQVSPTSPDGTHSNTTPRGTYLQPMNPLSVVVGMTNVSFVAQTATWLPTHLDQTIEKAWEHRGLSFVRILQRCPVFMPQAFGEGGRNFPVVFLENNEGVPIDPWLLKRGPAQAHDQRNINAAQKVAVTVDPAPMGLIYHNPELPVYEDVRHERHERPDHATFVDLLDKTLDRFTV
ncbi:2-oxoglutarate oxidoreductase subunit KorB [Planctomycetes bacterium CA13]|uniref:2-oxoglutarate oxidoreductase subunit KorB n=1 Tax=Novipirellula herctigrandis TaxID=2527986 RepID=A0A5C5YWL3_9BACT|nr:2-oxoglutarate oxidoreductase subunit KorB [Planctomycetes bacterium CA13]